MTEILGNPLICQLVVDHLSHIRDIANLAQVSTAVRSASQSALKYSKAARLSFRNTQVTTHRLHVTLHVYPWRGLKMLDFRGCQKVDDSIIAPLFLDTKIEALFIAGCTNIHAITIIKLLKGQKYCLSAGGYQHTDFAPIRLLDLWGIGDLLHLSNCYKGKPEWQGQAACPENGTLEDLLDIAFDAGITVAIDWCICNQEERARTPELCYAARRPLATKKCGRARFLPQLLRSDFVIDPYRADALDLIEPCPACYLLLHASDDVPLPSQGSANVEFELTKEFRDACDGSCQEELPLDQINVDVWPWRKLD